MARTSRPDVRPRSKKISTTFSGGEDETKVVVVGDIEYAVNPVVCDEGSGGEGGGVMWLVVVRM